MKTETVVRFTGPERFTHLLYAASFLLLAATGATLYVPQLATYAAGEAGALTRLVHRLAALAFMAAPVLYLALAPRQFAGSLRRILSWGAADLRWLGAGPRYYWTGDRRELPPQDKFNTGQKLHALVQVACFIVFAVTGLLLWVWGPALGLTAFRLSVILHSAAFVVAVGAFLVHVYLVLFHPLTRPHVAAMVDGTIAAEAARELYPRWYDGLRRSAGRAD